MDPNLGYGVLLNTLNIRLLDPLVNRAKLRWFSALLITGLKSRLLLHIHLGLYSNLVITLVIS